jgi:hypothetical protein
VKIEFLQKIFAPVRAGAFCCFAGVFEGCFGKVWCFGGGFCGDERGGLWS